MPGLSPNSPALPLRGNEKACLLFGRKRYACVCLLATTLAAGHGRSTHRHTVRLFIEYLSTHYPEVHRPGDLKRDPHMLGWLEHVWLRRIRGTSQPWSASTRAAHLIRLRKLLELLADHVSPPRPGLLLSQDIPRPNQTFPTPCPPKMMRDFKKNFAPPQRSGGQRTVAHPPGRNEDRRNGRSGSR